MMVCRDTQEFRRLRMVVWGVLFTALVCGCSHRTDPAQELNSALSPFSQTRDQAVGLVATAKHSLGAADLNTLAVSYAALEEKGNDYAGFFVEAVTDSSFDADRNAKYAANLTQAINTFNKSFASIRPPSQAGASVDSAWIPPFSTSVTSYWQRYHAAIADLSPQSKADLVKTLKARTVWPNYENIATEPLSTPTPH
jgi:hypothetical protein